MKVLVDKLPTRPEYCMFCQFPDFPSKEAGKLRGNCMFKVNNAKDWIEDHYRYTYDVAANCCLYLNDGVCPFLKEV